MSPSRRRVLQNIFRNAHEAARAIVAKEGVSYRAAFAAALAMEHKAAAERKAKRESDAASYLDCALGLPVRSCPADVKPQMHVPQQPAKPSKGFWGF